MEHLVVSENIDGTRPKRRALSGQTLRSKGQGKINGECSIGTLITTPHWRFTTTRREMHRKRMRVGS